MKSTIVLYYKSLVNAEKNFVLDDLTKARKIDSYLATLTKTTINDFQYIKHKLSLSIKVNMNQSNLEMIDTKDLNYCTIQNGTEKIYYYFVVDKRWTAKDTIELVLTMDTLNTFKFNVDYSVSKKTLTKRMHKDRFYKEIHRLNLNNFEWSPAVPEPRNGNERIVRLQFENLFTGELYDMYNVICAYRMFDPKPSNRGLFIYKLNEEYSNFILKNSTPNSWLLKYMWISGTSIRFSPEPTITDMLEDGSPLTRLIRKIDLKSEDISSPVYKESEQDLVDSNNSMVDWSLYYKNHDNQAESPIECLLIPSDPITVKIQTHDGDLTNLNIPVNKYVLFFPRYPSGNLTFITDNGNYVLYQETGLFYDNFSAVAIFNDNGTIRIFYGEFKWNAFVFIGDNSRGSWTEIATSSVKVLNSPATIYGYAVDDLPPTADEEDVSLIYEYCYNPSLATTEISMGALTNYTLYGKSTINKSLSENIKIINLPYCPTPTIIESGVYNFDYCWSFDTSITQMKLVDFTRRFKNTIVSQVENPIEAFDMGQYSSNIVIGDNRHLKDSKLFHSDYYRPKFVYDSFSKIFPLEQLDYYQSYMNMRTFDAGPKLNSFFFDFIMSRNIVSKFLFKFDYVYSYTNEDYPNVLPVARNNEEVLYSSQYLDYIRTGYNFDLKAKERQENAAATGLGLSVLGLVASGISAVNGNPIGLGTAVASGVGLANSLLNITKTIAQNEDNIQRKLAETQRQAVSVLNADDYDLLYEYTNNKAKMCIYKVSNNMEKVLDDLFYYVGYIVNEQKVPDISSRIWFNFVQASLVISDSSNLTTEIEDDIKEKFEQGVTFLHGIGQGTPASLVFDFSQEKENWETSLLYKDDGTPISI